MTTYFISTAHPEYGSYEFPQGSAVIDPFRMISPREGVKVRGLGRNRPETISILCPTRGRPDGFREMVESARTMATYPRQIEVVAYVDDDDPDEEWYHVWHERLRYIDGPRILLSEAWNECYEHSEGEILMHAGDDIRFLTEGWDVVVRNAFAGFPDKILFAYGDDLGPNGKVFGTHGFVHRRWVETLGYFVPPLFSSDWNDVWLNEVAQMIGRHMALPIITDHLHYTFGKAERDQTHADREERGERDDVVNLYRNTIGDRRSDAEKLRAVMS